MSSPQVSNITSVLENAVMEPRQRNSIKVQRFRRLINGPRQSVCPFLGLGIDATSHAGYPSGLNYCHCLKMNRPVKLDYQEEYCLSSKYITCNMFLKRMAVEVKPQLRRKVPLVARFIDLTKIISFRFSLGNYLGKPSNEIGTKGLPDKASE